MCVETAACTSLSVPLHVAVGDMPSRVCVTGEVLPQSRCGQASLDETSITTCCEHQVRAQQPQALALSTALEEPTEESVRDFPYVDVEVKVYDVEYIGAALLMGPVLSLYRALMPIHLLPGSPVRKSVTMVF